MVKISGAQGKPQVTEQISIMCGCCACCHVLLPRDL